MKYYTCTPQLVYVYTKTNRTWPIISVSWSNLVHVLPKFQAVLEGSSMISYFHLSYTALTRLPYMNVSQGTLASPHDLNQDTITSMPWNSKAQRTPALISGMTLMLKTNYGADHKRFQNAVLETIPCRRLMTHTTIAVHRHRHSRDGRYLGSNSAVRC